MMSTRDVKRQPDDLRWIGMNINDTPQAQGASLENERREVTSSLSNNTSDENSQGTLLKLGVG